MITRTGNLKVADVSEYNILPQYDKTVYTEPDGSYWIRVFHHSNPASGVFSQTDDFTHGVYRDANRWFDFTMCKGMTTCEFMTKQKAQSGSTEVKTRWIQTKSPWDAVYNDVKPSAVTRITTSGYTNNTTYGGGLYDFNTASKSRFVIATTTSGNWWGAAGAFANYQSGIPGANGTVCTTGYFDIYLKICYNNIEPNESKLFRTEQWTATELIEY